MSVGVSAAPRATVAGQPNRSVCFTWRLLTNPKVDTCGRADGKELQGETPPGTERTARGVAAPPEARSPAGGESAAAHGGRETQPGGSGAGGAPGGLLRD